MSAPHTPGPWRWELNERHKTVQLVGGRPRYDLTIIQPIRWGMGGATLYIRDTAEDGFNLLHKLHERRDWITPFAGRAHHASWCAGLSHPDMRLIESAPDLLEALRKLTLIARTSGGTPGSDADLMAACEQAEAAIERATPSA